MVVEALSTRLLACLDRTAVPIPTPDLIAEFGEGKKNPRESVWASLRFLRRSGLVDCRRVRRPRGEETGRGSGARDVTVWGPPRLFT